MNLTGLVNLPGDRITLSWFVNNLTNKAYNDQILTSSGLAVPPNYGGGTYTVPALPRTYGAAIRYTF